jgi:hypothetical protein
MDVWTKVKIQNGASCILFRQIVETPKLQGVIWLFIFIFSIYKLVKLLISIFTFR